MFSLFETLFKMHKLSSKIGVNVQTEKGSLATKIHFLFRALQQSKSNLPLFICFGNQPLDFFYTTFSYLILMYSEAL